MSGDKEVATVAIHNQKSNAIVNERSFTNADLSAPDNLGWRNADLTFGASNLGPYSIKVSTNGLGSLQIGSTFGNPISPVRSGDAEVRRQVPIAVLWLVVTVLIGVLIWSQTQTPQNSRDRGRVDVRSKSDEDSDRRFVSYGEVRNENVTTS